MVVMNTILCAFNDCIIAPFATIKSYSRTTVDILGIMLAVIWYITTLVLTKKLVMADDEQCTDFQFKSPFLPGESCEGIFNKNPESHNKSGYYWILSREYCGMSNTGSSCGEICNNHHDTCDKPGYYRINDKWVYCDMKQTVDPVGDFIPTRAGVGGGWRRVDKLDITIAQLDGVKILTKIQ